MKLSSPGLGLTSATSMARSMGTAPIVAGDVMPPWR
jgi:hypothetical protein